MSEDSNNKYYKLEKDRQAKMRKQEKELNKKYKQLIEEESIQEGINRLHPEDSTAEPEFAKGGLVGRGQGRAIKIKTTKMF